MRKLIIITALTLTAATPAWGEEIEMVFYPKNDTEIFKIYIYTNKSVDIEKYNDIIKLTQKEASQKIEDEFLASVFLAKNFIWAGYESSSGEYIKNDKTLKKYIKNLRNIKIKLDN